MKKTYKVISLISYLLSLISYLLSLISYLLSLISYLLSLISYRLNSLSRLNNNQKHFSILNSSKYNKHLSILSFKITHLIKISLVFLILFNLFLLITNCFTFNLKADNLPFSSDLIVNDSILSKITSFEQIHFQSCYKQGLDTSCGIATCATFLRFFYGINLDEKALILI